MKRSRFYISTELWDKGLSVYSIAVFTFLSFCSDSSGRSFPSLKEIARHCGVSVKSVQKALHELEERGLIVSGSRFTSTPGGKTRRASNVYRLAAKGAETDAEKSADHRSPHAPAGWEGMAPQISPHAPAGGEGMAPCAKHMNNININGAYESFGLSVNTAREGATDGGTSSACGAEAFREPAGGSAVFCNQADGNVGTVVFQKRRDGNVGGTSSGEAEDSELEELLFDKLCLDGYEDSSFAAAVELTLRDMWFARSITVRGETIPRERVRRRLRMLDVHCIDTLAWKMHLLKSGEVGASGRYLVSCIYNLPAEVRTDEAAFFADGRRAKQLELEQAAAEERKQQAREYLDEQFGSAWRERE